MRNLKRQIAREEDIMREKAVRGHGQRFSSVGIPMTLFSDSFGFMGKHALKSGLEKGTSV